MKEMTDHSTKSQRVDGFFEDDSFYEQICSENTETVVRHLKSAAMT